MRLRQSRHVVAEQQFGYFLQLQQVHEYVRKIIDNELQGQQRGRERGLQRLISNPADLQKSQREKEEDMARSQRLLKLLPDAFVFDYGERHGDLQEMKFKPNPHFRPPSHEAAAFHAMEGTLWVNAKQERPADVSGPHMRPVKFGGGLLGIWMRVGSFT